MGRNLDDALADLNANVLGSILEAFFAQLRNVPRQTIFLERRWQTAFQFVQDTGSRLEQSPVIRHKMAEVQAQVKRLNN